MRGNAKRETTRRDDPGPANQRHLWRAAADDDGAGMRAACSGERAEAERRSKCVGWKRNLQA